MLKQIDFKLECVYDPEEVMIELLRVLSKHGIASGNAGAIITLLGAGNDQAALWSSFSLLLGNDDQQLEMQQNESTTGVAIH